MQTVSRRLARENLSSRSSIYSLKSLYPVSDRCYGEYDRRYASTLTTKGIGHLVRKGTGGRSSVRYTFCLLKVFVSLEHELTFEICESGECSLIWFS
ncbi:hypothetical protein Hanom_Chr01g00011061 [Helianthus anomalus]